MGRQGRNGCSRSEQKGWPAATVRSLVAARSVHRDDRGTICILDLVLRIDVLNLAVDPLACSSTPRRWRWRYGARTTLHTLCSPRSAHHDGGGRWGGGSMPQELEEGCIPRP